MNHALIATRTMFIPTIGHTDSIVLKTMRITQAIALSTRSRRTLAWSSE